MDPREAIYDASLIRFQADYDDHRCSYHGALPIALGWGQR